MTALIRIAKNKKIIERTKEVKILLFGLGKTGTTALTYGIQKQLPDHEIIFEPSSLKAIDYNQKNLIVKSLRAQKWQEEKEDFNNFDKKILIVRHPFDRLISHLLYIPFDGRNFSNDYLAAKYIELLKRKTESPDSVNLLEIVNLLNEITTLKSLNMFRIQCQKLLGLYKKGSKFNFQLLKYEDFVDGNIQDVEQYLGITFDKEIDVDEKFKRVKRTQNYGDWKNWFTDKDLKKLSGFFEEFNSEFEYDTTLDPNVTKQINPEHSYLYTINVINDYRKANSLPEYQDGQINIGEEGNFIDQGIRNMRKNMMPEAQESMAMAIEKNPNIAGTYFIIGKILAKQKNYEEAEKALNRAIELNPNIDAHRQIAWIAAQKQKLQSKV